MSETSGIILFSAGAAWQNAFARALEQARIGDLILLGSAAGDASAMWLEEKLFSERSVLFSKNIFSWQDWVKERARSICLERGDPFRPLSVPRERELFRETLHALQ